MYLRGYGADSDMSDWKGSDAANVAAQRFANLVDTVNSLAQVAASNAQAAAMVNEFKTRVKAWVESLQTPIWGEFLYYLGAPATFIGSGIAKLLGLLKTEDEKYGVEYLNKVKAFEVEVYGALCPRVQQLTGKSVPACGTPPPAPVPIKPDPTIFDQFTAPVVELIKWGIIGVGVYYGVKIAASWLVKPTREKAHNA